MNNTKILTVAETAEELRMKQSTIRIWIHQKRLPVLHMGRKVFVKRETVERILEEGLEAVKQAAS